MLVVTEARRDDAVSCFVNVVKCLRFKYTSKSLGKF